MAKQPKAPRVLWEKASHRIVEKEGDRWMAGARQVRQLTLERRNSHGWSSVPGVPRVDYIRFWPRGEFYNEEEAIAFLQGCAQVVRN